MCFLSSVTCCIVKSQSQWQQITAGTVRQNLLWRKSCLISRLLSLWLNNPCRQMDEVENQFSA